MAKKQKRNVAQIETQSRPTYAEPNPRNANPSAIRSATNVDFNPDYTYVIKDLKRIAITAGGFIVLLVALSFFLK
jgi:hypothetical protein